MDVRAENNIDDVFVAFWCCAELGRDCKDVHQPDKVAGQDERVADGEDGRSDGSFAIFSLGTNGDPSQAQQVEDTDGVE